MFWHPAPIHQNRVISISHFERRYYPGSVLQITADQTAGRPGLVQSRPRLYDDLFRMIELALQKKPIVLFVEQLSKTVREGARLVYRHSLTSLIQLVPKQLGIHLELTRLAVRSAPILVDPQADESFLVSPFFAALARCPDRTW